MSSHLSGVRLPEADDANAVLGFQIAQNVQPPIELADRNVPLLSIFDSVINRDESGLEVEVRRALKGKPACFDVAGVFCWVEVDLHLSNCMHKSKRVQASCNSR